MRARAIRIPDAKRHATCHAFHQTIGKCEMCGSPDRSLHVTQNPWGSFPSANGDKTWTLCLDCCMGLRKYLRSLGTTAEEMRRITSFAGVHSRIGELLRSFGVGKRVPSALIASVADQKSWRSRLRELRHPKFDWKIAAVRYKALSGRTKCDYVLLRDGNLSGIPRDLASLE